MALDSLDEHIKVLKE